MSTYLVEAKENLSADVIAVIDAEIVADDGNTSDFATSQGNPGISFDRLNRTLVFSLCAVDPSGSKTNTTGHKLWSGIHTINSGASYDGYGNFNFSIMTRTLDSEVVTRWDAYDSASVVPNGIGPSDGTARRHVEADFSTEQGIKLTDPRTRNIASHHTMGNGDLSCAIEFFRFEDDYKKTLSPLIPSTDIHLELSGLNDDWWIVGYLDELTSNVYNYHLTPRLRTSDETAADYKLSYADFDAPAITANLTYRHVVDVSGNFWLFASNKGTGAARAYTLYKLTMPSSAPFGGPVVGGGWTTVTPWAAATGPNTRAAGYRGFNATGQDNNKLFYSNHTDDVLYCCAKFYPRDVYPTPTDDPADFHMDVDQIALPGLTFTHHADVITGWVTADIQPTTDSMEAAWAVCDMWEADKADLSYHSYLFPDVDYKKRKFFLAVVPVTAGVAAGYPDTSNSTPIVPSTHVLMIEIDFSGTPTWVDGQLYDETPWDDNYPLYAVAIGDGNIIRASMQVVVPFGPSVFDCGLWDDAQNAWWQSGQDPSFWYLDEAFAPRSILTSQYIEQPPFMKISFGDLPALPVSMVQAHIYG